jgi:succinate-semialdehyde dehydrogenase/glutarate-semialdehyde dehydrogenase
MFETRLYINGEWTEGAARQDVTNPATRAVIAQVSQANAEQVDQAVAAAHAAFPLWSGQSPRKRAQFLNQISQLMLKKKSEIAQILSQEEGKPLAEAVGEVIYSADFFAWYAEECRRLNGELLAPTKPGQELKVTRAPVGVVAAITPWNFPIGMLARKLAPALAAGCTVVLKPASQTPLTAIKFMEIVHEIGLPPGVINLIIGSGSAIGSQLMADRRVRKVTFTGSTQVGSAIMRQAADRIVNVSLELGGHAPFIVLDDADLSLAVKHLLLIKMRNAGQTCISPNRIFVHRSQYDAFLQTLVEKVGQLVVGPYDLENVNVGPLIDQNAMKHMQAQVDDAVAKGARLLAGGKAYDDAALSQGNFYPPTVLADVTTDMNIFHEETFGPLIPVIPFDSDSELIELANNCIFGLAAYLYTNNYKRAHAITEALEYGVIAVNDFTASDLAHAPVGGMKESGIGREGGREGLDAFLETKFTLVQYR